MDVLHILPTFLPHNIGGIERYVEQIILVSKKQGGHHAIAVPSLQQHTQWEINGIQVYVFDTPGRLQRQDLLQNHPQTQASFQALLHTVTPKVCHFHYFNWAVPAVLTEVAQKNEIRTFFTPHVQGEFMGEENQMPNGVDFFSWGNVKQKLVQGVKDLLPFFISPHALKKRDLQILQKTVDCTLVLNTNMEQLAQKSGLKNVRKLPVKVYDDWLVQDRTRKRQSGMKRLGFVGRISHEKNLEFLVNVLRTVTKTKPFELVMVVVPGADTSLFERIKREAQQGIQCTWLEHQSRAALKKIYADLDVILLPSITEVSPLVVLEAMASGVPVIGSKIPGICELVKHNVSGYLAEVSDREAWVAAITRFIDGEIGGDWHEQLETPALFSSVYPRVYLEK